MAINQMGSGGLQSVNMLYGQNQANPSPPVQKSTDQPDPVEIGKSVTVNISPESQRMSQAAKTQGVEKEQEMALQKMDQQQTQQVDGSGRTNGTETRSQERIDLFA